MPSSSDHRPPHLHAEPGSSACSVIRIAVPVPVGRGEAVIYDYRADKDDELQFGQIVLVPVGKQTVWGLVVGFSDKADIEDSRLKTIIKRADSPPLTDRHITFLKQVSLATLAPFGAVMKLMLNCPAAFEPPPLQTCYSVAENYQQLVADSGLKLTPQRQRLLTAASGLPPLSLSDLAREAGVGTAVIKNLVKADIVQMTTTPRAESRPAKQASGVEGQPPELVLNDIQQQISQDIHDKLPSGHSIHLIDGVPGSGKTEVYFSLVSTILNQGRQVLIMLPEIVLTTAWQQRFEKWFGYRPDIWHSGLTTARRRDIWRRIIRGEPMVIAGARSALFLPFTGLGLIVVDEEHDASFKQEDYVSYQGRDMAQLRARLHEIPLILASATPSLESWVSACRPDEGWHHHRLSHRFGQASLPEVDLIDLRQNRPGAGKWISEPLLTAISDRLARSEQSLLFLNRRGYAPMTICDSCGARSCCHQCDSLLVTHRLAGRLQCHICGHTEPLKTGCSECGAADSLKPVGPGVERLLEEVAGHFPDASVAILSSDSMARSSDAEAVLEQITTGDIDIIIGTQMAAKGHHFPHLTLVGVVDADLGLGGGDLRASERTYQLLWQVAGRSGRDKRKGEVLIQTYQPSHPVMVALHDLPGTDEGSAEDSALARRQHFMQAEAEARAQAGMPPFGRLAAVILTATDFVKLEKATEQLEAARPEFARTQIYGPAPAAISRARGQFRMRYLIRADHGVSVQQILKQWLSTVKLPSGVRLGCDIDPYSFL